MDTPLLCVRGLCRSYGEIAVLGGLDFELSAGRAAAVVGPNGSGKTTLLRCVVGLDEVEEGEILLEGATVDESAPEVRAAVASVLDDFDFFPDLSIAEHLYLCAWSHGATDPVPVVEELLGTLDLFGARDQLPATLSSGQRRRVALASCFVRPRKLLVLDEPEQRLDAAGRAWLTEALNAEKAAGRAILLASHDQQLIEAVADELIEVGG